jgi:hypothetical protein
MHAMTVEKRLGNAPPGCMTCCTNGVPELFSIAHEAAEANDITLPPPTRRLGALGRAVSSGGSRFPRTIPRSIARRGSQQQDANVEHGKRWRDGGSTVQDAMKSGVAVQIQTKCYR